MRKFLATALLLLAASLLHAQNVSDLIISEVVAEADSSGIVDAYGRHRSWLELYNTSTGTVRFGGCYLTDDPTDLRKIVIPKADWANQLGPRQCRVLFPEGITLAPGKTIYLVSNDGRTVIDSLTIPAALPAGKSVSKHPADLRQQTFVPSPQPSTPTPGAPGWGQDSASHADIMKERDPYGGILSLVSVSVVFAALALLWLLFWLLFDRPDKKAERPQKSGKHPEEEVAAAIAAALDMEASGDEYAAISAAVHLYLSEAVHDVEPGIVTIRRTDAPWNDKSLTFRKLPRQI